MTNGGNIITGSGTSEDSKAPFVQLVIRVKPELHRQFRLAVLRRGKHGLTMASVIRKFIESYIEGGDTHA